MFLIDEKEVFYLELADGAEAGETIEDQEEVESIDGELTSRLLGLLGFDVGESAQRKSRGTDVKPSTRSVVERADRRGKRENRSLAESCGVQSLRRAVSRKREPACYEQQKSDRDQPHADRPPPSHIYRHTHCWVPGFPVRRKIARMAGSRKTSRNARASPIHTKIYAIRRLCRREARSDRGKVVGVEHASLARPAGYRPESIRPVTRRHSTIARYDLRRERVRQAVVSAIRIEGRYVRLWQPREPQARMRFLIRRS